MTTTTDRTKLKVSPSNIDYWRRQGRASGILPKTPGEMEREQQAERYRELVGVT